MVVAVFAVMSGACAVAPSVAWLILARCSLVGFVLVQARVRHPIMPLDLFHARGFRLALPVGFSGPITNRYGARLAGFNGDGRRSRRTPGHGAARQPDAGAAACVVPVGAGGALAMPSITSVVLEGVPGHQAGAASAVFNTFRQIGGAAAIAVFGALIADPNTSPSGSDSASHRRRLADSRCGQQASYPTRTLAGP